MLTDTAIIVTSYCGGNHQEQKIRMTKTLCKMLSEKGHYIILTTHSPIDVETQDYCDMFVYDKDNRFSFDGVPQRTTNHGVAELTLMRNAVKLIPEQFKYLIKMAYDNKPDLDYHNIIQKCKETGKKVVTAKWGNNITLGTQMYFSEIEFFNQTLSINELYRCEKDLEYVWYDSINEKGLLDQVHILENYRDFFGQNVVQYAHCGGANVDPYPYD